MLRDSAAIVVIATWTWREGCSHLHALTSSLSNVHSALLYPNHGKAPLCRILGVSLSLFWSIPQIAGGVLAFNSRGSASKTARPLGFLVPNAWESFWSETNGSQASQTNCRPIGLKCIESAYLQRLPASYHTQMFIPTPPSLQQATVYAYYPSVSPLLMHFV